MLSDEILFVNAHHFSLWSSFQQVQSTSWSSALPKKLPVVKLLKNFPAFYGTRSFITVFTSVLHCSLSWARSIQSISSHPISVHPILTLSTYLRLGLPSGFLWLSHQYPICIPLRPHSCYMSCPSYSLWLDHSNYTLRRVQVMKLLIMQFSPTLRHFTSLRF
jgi:hypothetical protein